MFQSIDRSKECMMIRAAMSDLMLNLYKISWIDFWTMEMDPSDRKR